MKEMTQVNKLLLMKIGCLAKIFVLLLNDGKTVKKVKSFKCGFKK